MNYESEIIKFIIENNITNEDLFDLIYKIKNIKYNSLEICPVPISELLLSKSNKLVAIPIDKYFEYNFFLKSDNKFSNRKLIMFTDVSIEEIFKKLKTYHEMQAFI